MGDDIYFRIQAWATNILVIVFSSIVLLKFTKIREKTGGLYMILILTITDLLNPFINALTIQLVVSHESARVIASIASFLNRFSLNWSVAIAIYTYQVLVSRDFNERVFIKKAFALTCATAALFPIIILLQLFGTAIEYIGPGLYGFTYPTQGVLNKIMYLLVLDGFGFVLPSALIFLFYYKVSQTIKKSYGFIGASGQVSSLKSVSFAIIPIFCFGPEVLADCFYIFQNITVYPFAISLIVSLTHRCWGFLNLCAFWFLNPLTNNSIEIQGDETNDTFRTYSNLEA